MGVAMRALVIWLVLIAGCGASSSPTTTERGPRWCPRSADNGQRYYVMCDEP